MAFQTQVGADDRPVSTAVRDLTVDALMTEAFSVVREPRSPEYQAGARSILAHYIDGQELTVPYALGTAQADAFFAGREEGKAIWRRVTMDRRTG